MHAYSRHLLLCAALVLLGGCGGGGGYSPGTAAGAGASGATGGSGSSAPPSAAVSPYSMSKLVSDGPIGAALTDTNLVNAWGIVFAPNAPVWVANNGTQTSTIYNGIGTTKRAAVSIPAGINGDADPTGIVFNSSTDFVITEGAHSAAASFILDGEGGTISGWAGSVDLQKAIVRHDDGAGGAVYKGLAIATDGSGTTRLVALVNVASVEQSNLQRVNPGNPGSSYLIQKLAGTPGISGARMPFGGPFLDQATLDEVANWITQGAANN